MTEKLNIIKVKKAHSNHINEIYSDLKDAGCAFQMAARMSRQTHKRFWEVLEKYYPEIKDYVCHYDNDKKGIVLERKKRNGEQR